MPRIKSKFSQNRVENNVNYEIDEKLMKPIQEIEIVMNRIINIIYVVENQCLNFKETQKPTPSFNEEFTIKNRKNNNNGTLF